MRGGCPTVRRHVESDRAGLVAAPLSGHVAHSRHLLCRTSGGEPGSGRHPPDGRAVRADHEQPLATRGLSSRKRPPIMIIGYPKPLYFLPFDHRGSFVSGLFKWKEPLNVEQMVRVARSKHTIYAGFERAIADEVVPKDSLGILVDEQFGTDILRDAANKGYIKHAS